MLCYTPSPYVSDTFCTLDKGHSGAHVAEANGQMWVHSYDLVGLEVIRALDAVVGLKIEVTVETAKLYSKIFERLAENLEYHHYNDCDHSDCQADREPCYNEGRD